MQRCGNRTALKVRPVPGENASVITIVKMAK